MLNRLVLVLNCGSSSLKFAIIDTLNNYQERLSGIAECLNLSEANIKWKIGNFEQQRTLSRYASHSEAMNTIVNVILTKHSELFKKIIAIGHRIVHGGKQFTRSTIIDDIVLKGIEHSIPFAPLHNPSHLIGIQEAMKHFPHLAKKNVAVFDTAFHQTMPEEAYLYAIPYLLYKKYSIRRYGAHGISHFYVSHEASRILKKSFNALNVITCHLGNGGSISAICNGKCVDTSMGLTPLEGIVMGTRSGDIDPGVIFYLNKTVGLSIDEISTMLTRESGLLGLTGVTSDCRYIERNYHNNRDACRAMNIYCRRLAKYIGSYATLMEGRLDALIFTGGIGENSSTVREIVLSKLSLLDFEIDRTKNINVRFGKTGFITTDTSRPAIVIPTKEEIVIAKDTAQLVQ